MHGHTVSFLNLDRFLWLLANKYMVFIIRKKAEKFVKSVDSFLALTLFIGC